MRWNPGKYEITIYTSCVNADKGIYYYTTYENHQIQAVDMHRENLGWRYTSTVSADQRRADSCGELRSVDKIMK